MNGIGAYFQRINDFFFKKKKVQQFWYIKQIEVSLNPSVVPENCIWITREISVNNKQTHSWFLLPPFVNNYLAGRGYLVDSKVYLQWPHSQFKIQQAKGGKEVGFIGGFEISNNISPYPVWFSSGTKITTQDERVNLKLDQYQLK